MEPFFSCRKASKGRPLQGTASGSAAGVGPCVVVGGGETTAAVVLKVGATVVATGVTVSVASSSASKVSPRATEGGGKFHQMRNKTFDHLFMVTCCSSTDSFWGTRSQSLHSSFHSTHTWSRTGISSVDRRSHTHPHRTLWRHRNTVIP